MIQAHAIREALQGDETSMPRHRRRGRGRCEGLFEFGDGFRLVFMLFRRLGFRLVLVSGFGSRLACWCELEEEARKF